MARQQSSSRNRTALYLVAAVIAAALTAAVVAQVVQAYQKQVEAANARPDAIRTVVAVRDLYMGLPITQEDVTIKEVSSDVVPIDQAFQSIDEVVGRTPRERILASEVIRFERLARRDAGIGLNAIVTPGKRAMTVAVDTESGVAGFLQPNNFVDVIVTIRPDDDAIEENWLTETILQGVKVLAVDASMTSNAEAEEEKKSARSSQRKLKPSVTLEITLEEAEKLALASSKGDLHLVLRSDVDISPVETNGAIVINDMLGINGEEPTPETRRIVRKATGPTPPASTVEVIQGSDRSQTDFDAQGNQIEGSGKRR